MFLRINLFLWRHFEMISVLLFKGFSWLVRAMMYFSVIQRSHLLSCTTSVSWSISINTPGDAIKNPCVFKVPYMFRKLCIVFILLVAKCFCMVVKAKLEIVTPTVICMRIGDCWYNCFINNAFSKTFTVEWAVGWILAVTLTFLVGLWWWKYFSIVLFD